MQITDQAKQLLDGVMEENGMNAVRVVFSGMGWSGPNIGLALDEPAEDDEKREINGIQVAIEQQILPYVEGVTLDMESDEEGQPGLVMSGAPGEDGC